MLTINWEMKNPVCAGVGLVDFFFYFCGNLRLKNAEFCLKLGLLDEKLTT